MQTSKIENTEIQYKKLLPDKSISDYVECFWQVENDTNIEKEIIVMPDGNIDLLISKNSNELFHIWLMGLDTCYNKGKIEANAKMFFISFKLFAIEYLFRKPIANIINGDQQMPNNFWGFEENDLNNFEKFCIKATNAIKKSIPNNVDNRKQKLFELIYASNGEISVSELSERVFWSSRQINRYFTHYFGISLKTYCGILRFRASFEQIKDGKLYPEHNFSDQAHFSREVKKLSGVNPRELYRNKNDRFIQVSAIS